MPSYMVKPTNRILVGPANTEIVEMKIGANATAAQMVPGRFVIYDAATGSVKEAGAKADDVFGVLEIKSGMKLSDNYAVADPCNVIRRSQGARVLITLLSGGAAVVPGDRIVTAGNGKGAKQAVGAMGAQGTVVAIALTDGDPSAADVTIVAELTGGAEPAAAS